MKCLPQKVFGIRHIGAEKNVVGYRRYSHVALITPSGYGSSGGFPGPSVFTVNPSMALLSIVIIDREPPVNT